MNTTLTRLKQLNPAVPDETIEYTADATYGMSPAVSTSAWWILPARRAPPSISCTIPATLNWSNSGHSMRGHRNLAPRTPPLRCTLMSEVQRSNTMLGEAQ